jgi:hypothetical protein
VPLANLPSPIAQRSSAATSCIARSQSSSGQHKQLKRIIKDGREIQVRSYAEERGLELDELGPLHFPESLASFADHRI